MSVPEVADWFGVSERTVVRWTQMALSYYGHPIVKTLREKMDRIEEKNSHKHN